MPLPNPFPYTWTQTRSLRVPHIRNLHLRRFALELPSHLSSATWLNYRVPAPPP
ncbi:unnamed protein product [Nesidiocoris tenuis]|uniref:Uncharacterized protein n=1 Tax=Nesidiocoris tenuis TaxID=355587 RepID=A0A6H5FYF9_9HEMI|nr:unnamed protein product [Nesidiocoris tenuis]